MCCSDRRGDEGFKDRLRRACSEHREAGERVQGILGSPEAHREARWFDDDESQVSTKVEIARVATGIDSTGCPRSPRVCPAKFRNFQRSVQCSINSRPTFFLRGETGAAPNGAAINYRKRISSFHAPASCSPPLTSATPRRPLFYFTLSRFYFAVDFRTLYLFAPLY